MKIAYLLSHDITKNDGVTKKILGQTDEWIIQGYAVEIYCFVPKQGKSILESARQYEYGGALNLRFKLQDNLLSDLNNFNPDIVYFRYDTWYRTLAYILNKYKVVTELNTYDLGEFWLLFKKQKSLKSFFRYLAYKLLRAQVLSKVSGIVSVTKEIAEHSSNKKFNKPTIFIPNGIDLEKYRTIKDIHNSSERIQLFFIGTPNQPWHGVDIIERIAKKLPQYDFHIVGIEGENTNNLFWHGYLQKEEYLEVLKKCHICIGSLALYRNKMSEACPLKVREYLAYGYPIIIGYKDTAFLDKKLPGWVIQIDSSIELYIKAINAFIEKNKYEIVTFDQIESYVSSKNLEKNRLLFFTKVL